MSVLKCKFFYVFDYECASENNLQLISPDWKMFILILNKLMVFANIYSFVEKNLRYNRVVCLFGWF